MVLLLTVPVLSLFNDPLVNKIKPQVRANKKIPVFSLVRRLKLQNIRFRKSFLLSTSMQCFFTRYFPHAMYNFIDGLALLIEILLVVK